MAPTTREPLFRRVLGAAFDDMPPAVRALHQPGSVAAFKGVAQVEPADNRVGSVVARLFRLPRPSPEVAVEVIITAVGDCEIWDRRFGANFFSTTLATDASGKLTETFGSIRFRLGLAAHERGLDMIVESGRMKGIHLPGFLLPWTRAEERVDASGRFTFDVEIGLRGVGRLVRYRGWLQNRIAARAAG